jgi:hypothetical protein
VRKKKIVIKAAQAAPATRATLRLTVGIIVLLVGVAAWKMVAGRTPNIDRIASEGALFTDYYAQQSCTAGRAAFILGQTPFRTGLLMVGLPGAKQGLQDKDPTIAELLKPLGYATSQIGKNHLGDRNEYLPTVHGFDEFYGMTMVPATVIVSQFLQTFEAFPPSQKSGGLTVTQFLDAVQKGASGAGK